MSLYPDWIGPTVAGTINRSYVATHSIELDMSTPEFEFSASDYPLSFNVLDQDMSFEVAADDHVFDVNDNDANTFSVSEELPLEA